MKKRRAGIIILVLMAVAAFLLWRAYFHEEAEKGVLLLSGNMEVTEFNIGFKIPGRVVELSVDEGQQVQAGQVLARLDNAELASIVTQSKASLREAQSRLDQLKAGSRPQEIEEARAIVRSQEAEATRLRKDYERAEMLYKNGAISTAQLDAAKSAYETRAAQQRSAMESLSLVKEGPRKQDIEAAGHRVEQARAAISTAEERLKDTVITAPAPGVVLRKNVELGETVGAGVPIFTIGDLSSPWIKVYVPEPQLTLVKLGQRAHVTVDTDRVGTKKTYDGWVSYISNEAEFTPKSVQTQEERVKLVYGVKVRVDNPNQDLKPGMPADVRILLMGLASPPPAAKPPEPPPQSSLRSDRRLASPPPAAKPPEPPPQSRCARCMGLASVPPVAELMRRG